MNSAMLKDAENEPKGQKRPLDCAAEKPSPKKTCSSPSAQELPTIPTMEQEVTSPAADSATNVIEATTTTAVEQEIVSQAVVTSDAAATAPTIELDTSTAPTVNEATNVQTLPEVVMVESDDEEAGGDTNNNKDSTSTTTTPDGIDDEYLKLAKEKSEVLEQFKTEWSTKNMMEKMVLKGKLHRPVTEKRCGEIATAINECGADRVYAGNFVAIVEHEPGTKLNVKPERALLLEGNARYTYMLQNKNDERLPKKVTVLLQCVPPALYNKIDSFAHPFKLDDPFANDCCESITDVEVAMLLSTLHVNDMVQQEKSIFGPSDELRVCKNLMFALYSKEPERSNTRANVASEVVKQLIKSNKLNSSTRWITMMWFAGPKTFDAACEIFLKNKAIPQTRNLLHDCINYSKKEDEKVAQVIRDCYADCSVDSDMAPDSSTIAKELEPIGELVGDARVKTGEDDEPEVVQHRKRKSIGQANLRESKKFTLKLKALGIGKDKYDKMETLPADWATHEHTLLIVQQKFTREKVFINALVEHVKKGCKAVIVYEPGASDSNYATLVKTLPMGLLCGLHTIKVGAGKTRFVICLDKAGGASFLSKAGDASTDTERCLESLEEELKPLFGKDDKLKIVELYTKQVVVVE